MEDDKLIPLSYVSQYCYCKRRVGLLMLEQQWSDSTDTVKGSAEHRHVHTADAARQHDTVILTDLAVVSHEMDLFGRCDVVEARLCADGVILPLVEGKRCSLYPIEYKHGKLRTEHEYELQLCAQAMCLEEMFQCKIPAGALFFISSHRRKEILFDEQMREQVRETATALAAMLQTGQVPPPENSAKCIRCSLKEICQPEISTSASAYLKQLQHEWKKGD